MANKKAIAAAAPKSTSLKLDPELHRRARRYAFDVGKTLQVVLAEALAEYLKKKGA